MGVWTCGAEEEGLGDAAGCVWVEELNSLEGLVSSCESCPDSILTDAIGRFHQGVLRPYFQRRVTSHPRVRRSLQNLSSVLSDNLDSGYE